MARDFAEQLREEIAKWIGDSIVSKEQADKILARYAAGEGDRHSGRLITIISIIGGAVLAVGISLLIAANWQEIPPWSKIGGVVLLLGGANYFGWRLRYSTPTYPKTGEALLLVGGILFLAGIGLISQIYHLNARPATGLLIWWLAIAATPYLLDSRTLKFLSLIAFCVWLGWEGATENSWLYLHGNEWAFFIAFLNLGLIFISIGALHRDGPFARFQVVYDHFGMLLALGSFYGLGFIRYDWQTGKLSESSFALAIFCLVSIVLLWLSDRRWPDRSPWHRHRFVLALCAISVCSFLLTIIPWSGKHLYSWEMRNEPVLLAISAILWVGLFLYSLLVINCGIRWGRRGWVNWGIAFIALNIGTRYFDLLGGMMETGLLFVFGGVLLLGGGIYLEKRRRKLVARIQKS